MEEDYFDSHCHLTHPKFADDLVPVINRAREAGVRRMVTVGTDLDSSQRAAELAPTGERAVLAAMIALDHALVQPADDALTSVRKVLARAETLGHAGSVLAAQTRLAQLSLAQGDAGAALEALAAVRQSPEDVEPNDLYRGEAWLAAVRVLRAAGRTDEAAAQSRLAAAEIRRIAASELPAELRDGFLHRNPVNRELLTLATRG